MEAPTVSNSKVVEDRRGTVYIENPQKDSHCSPPDGCHGLVGATVTLGGGKKFSQLGVAVTSAQIQDLDAKDDTATTFASQVILITVNAGKPLTADGDITAGTTLSITTPDPEGAAAEFNASAMTLNELAQLLTVKAKGDTYKATAPNPKAEILQ
eukprot:COSAG03_NODE_13415_length_504_cov_0.644444_1_plen_154_part_01